MQGCSYGPFDGAYQQCLIKEARLVARVMIQPKMRREMKDMMRKMLGRMR